MQDDLNFVLRLSFFKLKISDCRPGPAHEGGGYVWLWIARRGGQLQLPRYR